MRIAIYLLCFFALFLRINDHAFAGICHESISYMQAQRIKKNLQTKLTPKEKTTISDAAADAGTDDYLLDDDLEDEDQGAAIVLKHTAPVRHLYSYPYQSILSSRSNCFKTPPSFCGTVSCKYLVLRMLRL